MKSFRDVNTGLVAEYPDHFAALFPSLVEVDPETAECVECTVVTPEVAEIIAAPAAPAKKKD